MRSHNRYGDLRQRMSDLGTLIVIVIAAAYLDARDWWRRRR